MVLQKHLAKSTSQDALTLEVKDQPQNRLGDFGEDIEMYRNKNLDLF